MNFGSEIGIGRVVRAVVHRRWVRECTHVNGPDHGHGRIQRHPVCGAVLSGQSVGVVANVAGVDLAAVKEIVLGIKGVGIGHRNVAASSRRQPSLCMADAGPQQARCERQPRPSPPRVVHET
jgi:hypothetical protein